MASYRQNMWNAAKTAYKTGIGNLRTGIYDTATGMGNARGSWARDYFRSGPERQNMETDLSRAYQYYLATAPRLKKPAAPVYTPPKYDPKGNGVTPTNRWENINYNEYYQQQVDDYNAAFKKQRNDWLRENGGV